MAESNHSAPHQAGVKRRRPIACNFCRQKKVRCDGECPCKNCTDHDEVCVFEKRKLRRKKQDISTEMAERLTRIEALFITSQKPDFMCHSDLVSDGGSSEMTAMSGSRDEYERQPAQRRPAGAMTNPPSVKSWNSSPGAEVQELQATPFICQSSEELRSHHTSLQVFPSQQGTESELGGPAVSKKHDIADETQEGSVTVPAFSPHLYQGRAEDSVGVSGEGTAMASVNDTSPEDSSVYSGNLTNWEYHGPRSYLSICSPAGVEWVLRETKACSFQQCAGRLAQDVTRRLKIESRLSWERVPEPDSITAWKYITAYFERTKDTFEFVDRQWFESKFQSYLEDKLGDVDPAWYCLRNAIYATGCRIELTKTHGFTHAFETAWSFFTNCLVVHTELLFFRSSWMGVQALTIMGYFSEAIGNPCLEYMLSTVAMRLACSKGLHRQGISSTNQKEQNMKNKVFWASYCLEKNCAARSGRPSMIDDDHVTCLLPNENQFFNRSLIKLAQLSSFTAKEVTRLESLCFPRQQLVLTMSSFSKKSESLKMFLKKNIDLESSPNISGPRIGASYDLQNEIHIRMSYYTVVLDMHTFLTNPWSRRFIDIRSDRNVQEQLRKSQDIVADVSRQAILASQFIRLDATSLVLVAFQCPLYALINLFVHIIQNPDHSAIQSDLALMDIGAAHFSRLEYSTNAEISVPFARDLASLARTTVDSRKNKTRGSEGNLDILQESFEFLDSEPRLAHDLHNPFEGFAENNFFPDLEQCSTFLPTTELNEPIGFLI